MSVCAMRSMMMLAIVAMVACAMMPAPATGMRADGGELSPAAEERWAAALDDTHVDSALLALDDEENSAMMELEAELDLAVQAEVRDTAAQQRAQQPK